MERLRNLGISIRGHVEGAAKLTFLAPASWFGDHQLAERIMYDINATGRVPLLDRVAMIFMSGKDRERVDFYANRIKELSMQDLVKRRRIRGGINYG